jgi:hypothetical protein
VPQHCQELLHPQLISQSVQKECRRPCSSSSFGNALIWESFNFCDSHSL